MRFRTGRFNEAELGVDDVLYRKESGHETIEIRLDERNSVFISLKPHFQIRQD